MDENDYPDPQRKAQIRNEEIYRRLVIDELEKSRAPTTILGKLSKFFQSSFGGFVASSLLLPFGLWLFTGLQAHYARVDTTQKSVAQIDREITFRLRLTSNLLCDGATSKFVNDFSNATSAYPEFRGVNTFALLMQLSENLPESARPPVDRAVHALIKEERAELIEGLAARNWSTSLCVK